MAISKGADRHRYHPHPRHHCHQYHVVAAVAARRSDVYDPDDGNVRLCSASVLNHVCNCLVAAAADDAAGRS